MNDPGVLDSFNLYQKAHFSDEAGYQPYNHNLMREDIILQLYEYAQIFRKSFSHVGWDGRNMPSKKVLDVGSAWGLRLNQLLGFNFNPGNLVGIDLQEDYIAQARRINPLMTFEVMSATEMKYPDKYFDCSFACVVFQAMMDDAIIAKSLSEMCRVTREFILIVDIFDTSYSCERNGAIYLKGVDIKHIKNLENVETVEQVHLIDSFWTTSDISWLVYRLLHKVGFSALLSYAFAIRLFARHSHRAYLVKLRNDTRAE